MRKLSRRTILRGAGTLAIALPWLEAMGAPIRSARANSAEPAKRFIAVYQPGGTVPDRFFPAGSETDFELSEILSPLEIVKDKLLIPTGLEMKCARGEQHQAGIVGLLTGMAQGTSGNYVNGPSLDQVIARTASEGKQRKSIEMAVRWATGKSHGLLHPINCINFADDGNASPIPPRIDPVEIYQSLFGNLDPDGDGMSVALAQKRSMLDFLDRRYHALAQTLGQSDRARLEEHLTKIRELEQGLSVVRDENCVAPALVDTSDYDPRAGLAADDGGNIRDESSDAAIPKVGRFMMDMMVMAMACDMTAVGTMQWSDTEAKHTFPWLGLSEHHHFYQHDGGFRPDECAQIGTWYAEQHAYLLGQMAEVDMGGHSLLDESVVFVGTELAQPSTHTKTNMPFLLAGGGGGLRGGRLIDYDGASHNDLLSAILNLFGAEVQTFGDPEFATAPLSGLT